MVRWKTLLAVVSAGLAVGSCGSNSSVSTTSLAQPVTVDSTISQSLDEIDSEILAVTFDGEAVDQPAPYFGAQDTSGTASQPEAGFAPDALYQEFCWAVSVINSRPQPRDEFEEVLVASAYFGAIEQYVVPDLRDELALLIEFTASIVADGSFTEEDEGNSDAALAVETINQFVDQECLGRSS